MLYKSRPHLVRAFQFDGTFTGAGGLQAADDWLKDRDLENCEVTCQGQKEPLALDVITPAGFSTLEKGGWLFTSSGILYTANEAGFEETFEAAE